MQGVVLYGFIQHTAFAHRTVGLGKAIRNFKQASSELDEVDATFKKDEKDITK